MKMSFQKAKAEQAALKASMFGPPGSGKTATALLFAEGLSNHYGGRVAYVDTERGTDFYVRDVPEREWHPAAFDIDALYTRSLPKVLEELKRLDSKQHSVIVIDSMSHLWDDAINSYQGRRNAIGAIPMHAWTKIKEPYKALMDFLLGSPFHVFILGRQATDFVENEKGELESAGVKMRVEKETPYDPHLCFRMEAIKRKKTEDPTPTLFVEKDRSGILGYKSFAMPTFAVIEPLLALLSGTQAAVPQETMEIDSEFNGEPANVNSGAPLHESASPEFNDDRYDDNGSPDKASKAQWEQIDALMHQLGVTQKQFEDVCQQSYNVRPMEIDSGHANELITRMQRRLKEGAANVN